MVHVHGRRDDGFATYEIERIRQIYDAIKQKTPELIVNISSAASPDATPEQRIAQIIAIKPEMASLNTNTMNFSIMNRKQANCFRQCLYEYLHHASRFWKGNGRTWH